MCSRELISWPHSSCPLRTKTLNHDDGLLPAVMRQLEQLRAETEMNVVLGIVARSTAEPALEQAIRCKRRPAVARTKVRICLFSPASAEGFFAVAQSSLQVCMTYTWD